MATLTTATAELLDDEPEVFGRITCTPGVLGGKPCIAGSRISVQIILEWLAGGGTIQDIAVNYPFLKVDDIRQAVLFAASHMSAESFAKLNGAA
ncbi:hypothetical protein BH11PLA2_BH11PLA2_17970 [soil metagenome]